MGTFAIWHWFIVLAILLMPLLPIFLASADERLTRTEYLARSLGVIVAGFVLNGIATLAPFLFLLSLPLTILSYFLFLLWTVHRLQDVGGSRWVAFLFILPFVGIFVWIALIFIPTEEEDERPASGPRISAP